MTVSIMTLGIMAINTGMLRAILINVIVAICHMLSVATKPIMLSIILFNVVILNVTGPLRAIVTGILEGIFPDFARVNYP